MIETEQNFSGAELSPDHIDAAQTKNGDNVVGFTTNQFSLPKGYYRSVYFIGANLSIGLGLFSGVAGYGLTAPVLSLINKELGPSKDIIWVAFIYSLLLAVGFTLFGRFTDIFGRRWCCIGGACFGLLGSILGATANSIGQLIAGAAFIGIGASTQMSYNITTGELVPMKYRFLANSIMFVFCIPGSGFGPAVATSFILKTRVGWRGIYYLLISTNGASLVGIVAFYFPPTFKMKHHDASLWTLIKNMDYGGVFLYTAGLLLLLMGLSWGDTLHPWKSAAVIAPIVVGILCLVALGFYEVYMPLEEPLVPPHLFKNIPWVASIVLLGLSAGVYYAFAIVWPQMVSILYANGDLMYVGVASCAHGSCIILGQMTAGVCAKPLGRVNYQAFLTYLIGGILLCCIVTTNPDTKARAIGLLCSGCFFVGWTEGLGIGLQTVAINNQQEIGTAAGISSSVRSGLGTIAAAVYTAVLTTRLQKTIPERVPQALTKAGLPASSIPAFLQAIQTGSFTSVPGISQSAIIAGTTAYKWAASDAFHTVFLTTLAFTGLGLILCYWVPDVNKRLTDDIVTTLHQPNTEAVVAGNSTTTDPEK